MTYTELIKNLRSKKTHPVYLLHGEEAYFIDEIVKVVERELLSESERSFNQTVLYGPETDYITVLDNVRRYPMMSDKQVVILKEAQGMKSLAELAGYIEKPTSSTIFCIAHKHKKCDMRTKFGKALMQHAVVFESKPLYEDKMPDWIRAYLADLKLTTDKGVATTIGQHLGTDLSRVASELDKLALNVPPNTTVTQQHVEKYIGISKEYNVFELNRALGKRDVLKAQRIAHYFAANPKSGPIVVVVSALYGFFSKLYMYRSLSKLDDRDAAAKMGLKSEWAIKEYKEAASMYNTAQIEQVFHYLYKYDLRSKGVDNDSATHEDLLTELIWLILHV